MNSYDKYWYLLLLSLSVIPLGIVSLLSLLINSWIILLIMPVVLIPIWLLCFIKIDKADEDDYNMQIKKEMQDDFKRLGITKNMEGNGNE